MLNFFPGGSVQGVGLLLTLLQAAVDSLRASGVDIQAEMEEKVERLKVLVKHLQERSREGTLSKNRDSYAFLHTGDPGNVHYLFIQQMLQDSFIGMKVQLEL